MVQLWCEVDSSSFVGRVSTGDSCLVLYYPISGEVCCSLVPIGNDISWFNSDLGAGKKNIPSSTLLACIFIIA